MAVPALALAACGDDDTGGTTDATTQSDGTGSPDGEVNTPVGTSALTGVNTNVSVNTPTANPSCPANEVDNGSKGIKYPWGGLTADGKNYTCNKCPTGLADFQGMWRSHGFGADEATPDYSKGGDADIDDAEIFYIDGNTWYSMFRDLQTNQTLETRGWFVCTQQPEHPNEHLFWVTLEAIPAGTFGANAGSIDESDVILSQGSDKKLIFWYDSVGGNTGIQIGYCKIGTTSNGQTCNNPFE
jgi:hypothetical protein